MEAKKEKSRKEIEEEAKLKKINEKKLEKQIIVLFIILGLILLSFLGVYELTKPKPYFTYEGLKVYPAKIAGVKTLFYDFPIAGNGEKADILIRNDPRKLNVPVEINSSLSGIKQVWITYPPYEQDSKAVLAANDLGAFTSKISLNTTYGMTDIGNSTQFTQITCNDSTDEIRVFLITLGNESRVYEQDNCVIVQGENFDGMIKAADALVVNWLLRIKL